MICPACKHPMMVMEYNKIELDYCDNCKGVWFDNVELDLLMKSLGMSDDSLLLKNMMACPEASSPENKRKCPICNKNMKKINVGTGKEIVIDICSRGHGLWFDGGELSLVLGERAEHCGPGQSDKVYGFLSEAFQFKS